MAECQTVRYLRGIAAQPEADPGLARAAAAALAIIMDIEAESMSSGDIDCLHALVDAIYKDGHTSLLAHLRQDAPDCGICAALLSRLQTLAT